MRKHLDAVKPLLMEDEDLPSVRRQQAPSLPGERANRDVTRQAAHRLRTDDQTKQWLKGVGDLNITDEIDDATAAQRADNPIDVEMVDAPLELEDHRTPEELPAVVNQAVGEQQRLQWHQVRNLPGYMAQQIRGIARHIFGNLTTTPLEDIQMLNSAMNPRNHVEAMMGWLTRHGELVDEFEINLDAIMPGYRAPARIYNALGYSFLCMQDRMGEYVYAWPRSDNAISQESRLRLEGLDPDVKAEFDAFMTEEK